MMTEQEIYSLAIQALHERRAWLQTYSLSYHLKAINQCEEAIDYLQEKKSLLQVLSHCNCPVTIEVTHNDCGVP